VIDFKGGDFGCFGGAKPKNGCPKKQKREQAPAPHTQFYTGLSIADCIGKSMGKRIP
jgi:hypothetical protein